MRILEHNQPTDGVMFVVGSNRGLNVLQAQRPIRLIGDGTCVNPTKCRNSAGLIKVSVRFIPENDLVSALTMAEHGRQVPHSARGDKNGRRHRHPLGGQLFEPEHGRIISKHVVTHFRLGHRLTHFRCGMCNGVRSEVNPIHICLLG